MIDRETLEKALKELNEEGLMSGMKITEQGKAEAENILKSDEKAGKLMLNIFLKKLENDFYETDFPDFCLKVLFLENLFKNLDINFSEKLKIFKNSKKF